MTTLKDSIQNEYGTIAKDTAGFVFCINNDSPDTGPRIHRVLYTKDLSRTVGGLKRVGDQRLKSICFEQGSNHRDWSWGLSNARQPYKNVSIKVFSTDRELSTGFAGRTLWELRSHIINNQVWCPEQAFEELEAQKESSVTEHSSETAALRQEIEELKAVIADLAKQVRLTRMQGAKN